MPFVDPDPFDCVGHVIGNGHCVALVRRQEGAFAPHTARWRPGAAVVGNVDLATGTAIATFDPDGHYGNHTDGRSHAAIFIAHEDQGLRVVDQWRAHPTQPRIIANRHGQGPWVDDASRYFVIEDMDT